MFMTFIMIILVILIHIYVNVIIFFNKNYQKKDSYKRILSLQKETTILTTIFLHEYVIQFSIPPNFITDVIMKDTLANTPIKLADAFFGRMLY